MGRDSVWVGPIRIRDGKIQIESSWIRADQIECLAILPDVPEYDIAYLFEGWIPAGIWIGHAILTAQEIGGNRIQSDWIVVMHPDDPGPRVLKRLCERYARRSRSRRALSRGTVHQRLDR